MVAPAVVADVDPTRRSARTSCSAPRSRSSVSGTRRGGALANSTAYGLGAGVFTGDVANAVRFAREVDAGNVHINWTRCGAPT